MNNSISLVRAFGLIVVVCSLIGCSSSGAVPCLIQADCVAYGAVCVERVCRLPEELDMAQPATAPGPGPVEAPSDLGAALDSASAPDLALACTSTEACPADTPICGEAASCRACVAGDRASCAGRGVLTPRCDEATGACAPCRTAPTYAAIDCADPALPVCGSDGSCRQACSAHAECASGICDPGIVSIGSRSCARPEEVVHVRPSVGCSGAHVGSASDPVCTIDDALALRPAGGFVRVLAGDGDLGRVRTLIDRPLVLVGTGTLSAPNELIAGVTATYSAARVGKGGRLHAEGISVHGAGASGIECDGGDGAASLRLLGVDLVAAGSVAVRARRCDVELERVRIRDGADGISHDGGLLKIYNTYVYRNAGVAISTTASSDVADIAHVTIADNVPASASRAGAFDCGRTMVIQNAIVWGNRAVAGRAYAGLCEINSSSVDPPVPNVTNNNIQPVFTPPSFQLGLPSDYHLKGPLPVGVNPCCLAKGRRLAHVPLDWDGQVRSDPPEIGADEL